MLKSIFLFIFFAITALVIVGVLFVNFAPQFGAEHGELHKSKMMNSPQYENGTFINQITTTTGASDPGSMFDTIVKFIKGVPNQSPNEDIQVLKAIGARTGSNRATKLSLVRPLFIFIDDT